MDISVFVVTFLQSYLATKTADFVVDKITSSFPLSDMERIIERSEEITVKKIDKAHACLETEFSIHSWLKTDEFKSLFAKYISEPNTLNETSLVRSFIGHGKFDAGDETEKIAQEIINVFLQELDAALLQSTFSIHYHDAKEKQRNQGMRELVTQGFSTLGNRISSALEVKENTERLNSEQTYHAQVDTYRDLQSKGKYQTAIEGLTDLREKLKVSSPSSDLLFRIATNIGAAHLRSRRYAEAERELETAIRLKPDDVKALSNYAQIKIVTGTPAEGLSLAERAMKTFPENQFAKAVYLNALSSLKKTKEIEEFVDANPAIFESVDCLAVLAQIKFQQDKYDEASQLIKKAMAFEMDNPSHYLFLTSTISAQIKKFIHSAQILKWKIPQEITRLRDEGLDMISRAIELLRKHDMAQDYHDALATRAGIYTTKEEFDKAISDCDKVLAYDPNHQLALWNKGIALLSQDHFNDAIEAFDKIPDKSQSPSETWIVARAYYLAKRYDAAISLIQHLWPPHNDDLVSFDIAELLISCFIQEKRHTEAQKIVDHLEVSFPDHPNALSVRAHFKRLTNQPEEAVHLLQKAYSSSDGLPKDAYALELAELFFGQEEFDKASSYYGLIVSEKADQQILVKYIITLYKAHEYKIALEWAVKLREKYGPLETATEIEAHIYDYQFQLEKAVEAWQQLSNQFPANLKYKVNLASFLHRRGKTDDAKDVIESISIENAKEQPESLHYIARLRVMLGLGEFVKYAYWATKLCPNSEEAHLAFIFPVLFARGEIPEFETPPKVKPGTVVFLEREAGPRKLIRIEDNEEGGVPSDLSRCLMGEKVGEMIVLKEGIEDLSYTIKEIKTKYLVAFEESRDNFTTYFPESNAINVLHLENNDFSKLKLMLDKRREHIKKVNVEYQGLKIPLTMFCKYTGHSTFATMSFLVRDKNSVLHVSSSDNEEISREIENAQTAKGYVLDLSAVYTLNTTGLLKWLFAGETHVYISQAAIDELNNILLQDFSHEGEHFAVFTTKNGIFKDEIPGEVVQKEKEDLEALIGTLKSQATITGADLMSTLSPERENAFKDVLSDQALTSILIAKEQNSILVADDLLLRRVAENDFEVMGTWSQPLLQFLFCSKVISSEEYSKVAIDLFLWGYQHAWINGDNVYDTLRRNNMKLSDQIGHLFEKVFQPPSSDHFSLTIAAQLFKRLWIESIDIQTRNAVLVCTLEGLTQRRPKRETVDALKKTVAQLMRLTPLHLQECRAYIDAWSRHSRIS